MHVIVYTTVNCPFCKMLKGCLGEKGVVFEERNVEENQEYQTEMLAVSEGFHGTPFTVITQDDGKQVKIKGFDKELVDKTLGLN